MEDQNQPLDAGMDAGATDDQLHISGAVRNDWSEIAKWAMFFAVLLFIALGLIAIGALVMVVTAGVMGIVVAIMMIGLYGTLLFFPAWYFYKFSTLTRQALNFEDNDALNEGFANLKRYYRFVGIVFIIIFSLYALMLLVTLAIGGLAALSS